MTKKAKRIAILGSTGSIGTQALDVVRQFPDMFSITGLTGNKNLDLLVDQVNEFEPDFVVVGSDEGYLELKSRLSGLSCTVLSGQEGLCQLATSDNVDVVLAALVGFAGVRSVLAGLEAGKTLALANKESLVVAGHLVAEMLESSGGTIIPVDSEHSAIFQCLRGESHSEIKRIILTASGGPFRTTPKKDFLTPTTVAR